jgi:zona occludens toxin (predicted ATPase)
LAATVAVGIAVGSSNEIPAAAAVDAGRAPLAIESVAFLSKVFQLIFIKAQSDSLPLIPTIILFSRFQNFQHQVNL